MFLSTSDYCISYWDQKRNFVIYSFFSFFSFTIWLACRNESPAEGLAGADVDQDLDIEVII